MLLIPADWQISAQGGRCLSLASSAVAFKSSYDEVTYKANVRLNCNRVTFPFFKKRKKNLIHTLAKVDSIFPTNLYLISNKSAVISAKLPSVVSA